MMQNRNETTPAQGRPVNAGSGGYKNPPKEHRFKPGRSGNARGRPRNSKGCKQIVQEIAAETHIVTENGENRRRTTLELVLASIRNSATMGNVPATRLYNELRQRYAPQETADAPTGRVIVPEIMPRDEWEGYMERNRAERARRDAAAYPDDATNDT